MTRAMGAALAGAALVLVALMFDASPLFVPGVAFVLVGLATPAWISLAARGARLHRRLHAARVVEEQPIEATIEVRRGLCGLPVAEILDPLAGAPVPMSGRLSLLRGTGSASVRVVAHFSRRGRKQLEPPSLLVRDALGLAHAVRRGETPTEELLVLPRTEPVRWVGGGGGSNAVRSAIQRASEPLAAAELDGLRPYRPGAPASRIHWPAVARGAGLLERRLQADAGTRPLVALDSRCERDSEALDAAVRAAASLALELARRGGCGLLLPGKRRPVEIDRHLRAWPAAHSLLALVEGAGDVRPPALAPGRLGPVFYVAARSMQRLPPVFSCAAPAASILVLPKPLTPPMRAAPSFEVSGCTGFALTSGWRPVARERPAGRPAREHAA
jgi:uncharacterized protein (DUF58 family)